MKRGTRIRYSYAGGKVVEGRVLRLYSERDIAAHRRSHGERAAELLPQWIPCQLNDEHGSYSGACHVSQLEVIR